MTEINASLDTVKPDRFSSSDEYAARFSGDWGAYLVWAQNRIVEPMLSAIGTSVLDIGGGHGQLISSYQNAQLEATIFGSDDRCFRQVDQTAQPCITGDLTSLPLDDKLFDSVVSVRMIPHLDEWQRVIDEMCRVSSDRVIIEYPPKVSFNALTPILFGVKKKFEKNTRPYTLFSHKEIRQAFERNGFSVVKQQSQLLLPFVIHRALKASKPLRLIESLCWMLGITRLLGSPTIVLARRD